MAAIKAGCSSAQSAALNAIHRRPRQSCGHLSAPYQASKRSSSAERTEFPEREQSIELLELDGMLQVA